jgi:hypothetical protein
MGLESVASQLGVFGEAKKTTSDFDDAPARRCLSTFMALLALNVA